MGRPVTLLIVGNDADAVTNVAAALRQGTNVQVVHRALDAAGNVAAAIEREAHDVRIVVVTENALAQIEALAQLPPASRKPTVVVGASDDPRLLRAAMRAGARDFFALPVNADELQDALFRIDEEVAKDHTPARSTAFINARGGAGGSVLAATVAHALALHSAARAALVDLDLQFGALSLYFDLPANRGLVDALKTLELLDGPALEAHMLKHASGLHLLAAPDDQLLAPGEVPAPRLRTLLDLIGQHYDQVILDLPRQLDAVAAASLQRAERIAVVLQQSLAHLRETKRLTQVLRADLEIPAAHIVLVVNRWDKNGPLSLRDIQQALPDYPCLTVRNDYRRVAESVSLGLPLLEAAPSAPVARDILALAEELSGVRIAQRKGLLARLLS